MMKQFIALLTLLALALTPMTLAEEAPLDIAPIEGVIEEISLNPDEDGLVHTTLLVTTPEETQVEVHLTAETLLESTDGLHEGDYIYVHYNGMMTRSLPPQITAEKIVSHTLMGVVKELGEEGFLMEDLDRGDVWVNATPEQLENVGPEAHIVVYFNGVMTMSLPGQISAGAIVPAVE